MTAGWIAERLEMETHWHLNHLLYRQRNAGGAVLAGRGRGGARKVDFRKAQRLGHQDGVFVSRKGQH